MTEIRSAHAVESVNLSRSRDRTRQKALPTSDLPSPLRLYETMLRIRALETKIEGLHHSGKMRGSFHSSMGQEAAAAGVISVLRPDDVVTSTHRGHGHAVAKGMALDAIIAELLGHASGASEGRGGSMHLHDVGCGFLGENGIVAGGIPWAAGAAWAARFMGDDLVGVAFGGDGAAAHGLFAETLRMARTLGSPFVLVCENNHLAHSMPVERTFGEPGAIAEWARSFGIKAEFVSGQDVMAVQHAAAGVVEHARREVKPALLEVEVWRVRAHSLHDPDYRYLPEGLGRKHLENHDPIAHLKATLPVEDADHTAILQRVETEVEHAVKRAMQDGPGPPELAFSSVYSERFESEAKARGW